MAEETKHMNNVHEHDMHGHDMYHRGHEHMHHVAGGHAGHHEHMIADFRKRFWISLIVSVPIVILSPMVQELLGLGEALRFGADKYVLFVLAAFVYVYGGYPFLKGLVDEIKSRRPGMMTLIAVAITVAFIYSAVVAG
jgi:Cu2+-exporting ATPase